MVKKKLKQNRLETPEHTKPNYASLRVFQIPRTMGCLPACSMQFLKPGWFLKYYVH